MNQKIKQIGLFLERRKYIITSAIFLIIIGVVDENSFMVRNQQKKTIAELKSQIAEYERRIKKDKKLLHDLANDPIAIEKIGRERYFMKRENEDIFIFDDTP